MKELKMRLVTLFLALLLTTSVQAQNGQRATAAEAYVYSKGKQCLVDEMISPEGTMAQTGLLRLRLTPEQQRKLVQIISEEISVFRPTLEQAMITGMAETFTLKEMNALAAFYSSDVGASAMKKMTPFMGATARVMAPTFRKMQRNIEQRDQEEMGNT